MTERDLYISLIPMIAEMAAECRRMDRGDYEDWKREAMEGAPDAAKAFMGKVLAVIDGFVPGGGEVSG